MSNKTFNVSYWKQSTGKTGQCLSERGQKIFDTLTPIYEEVVGLPLSKMKVYGMALEMSRQGRADEGFYMQNTATTAFIPATRAPGADRHSCHQRLHQEEVEAVRKQV